MRTAAPAVTVDSAELIERATALIPLLRDRAVGTKRDRRVPNETVAEFERAGLLRVLQPVRFGGSGGDFTTFATIVMTLARGCGSSAWVYAVLAEHAWAIAMFPEEAQQAIWGGAPATLASSSLAPAGRVEAVDGGYRLSGEWPFSSGCDFATWALLGAFVAGADGSKHVRDFLVPMDAITVLDDWNVLGLAATGSKTLRLDGVFVPHAHSVPHDELREASAPGRLPNAMTLCDAPRPLFGSFTLVSVLVGLAERAVELFVERSTNRVSRGIRVAELDSTQLNVAEAAAEADTARLIVRSTCERNMARVARQADITTEDLTLSRRNAVYAAKLASSAVTRVFRASGAHAIFDSDPLQTVFCDANAAAAHLFLNWELGARPYGQYQLGQPVDHLVI